MQPASASEPHAVVTVYTIPFWFTVSGNKTVPAGGNATVVLPMPYRVSPDKAAIVYRIMDANGDLLSNVSSIQLDVVINNQTKLTSVLLSSGSPAEAVVPLSTSGVRKYPGRN